MNSLKPIRRLFRLTPGRLIAGLFVFDAFLFLSDRLGWLGLGHHKGWAVLIALASVVVATVLLASLTALAVAFRWRLQFSIGSLLAVTVAAALACSWLTLETKKAKEQKSVVEVIRQVGGGVKFDYEDNADMDELLLGRAQPAAWPWLRRAFGDDFFANVTGVNFYNERLTDASLERVDFRRLPQLVGLNLGDTLVTDAAMRFLKGTPRLQVLDVGETGVTDAGHEQLIGLTQLQSLHLSGTSVRGGGLKYLKGLAKLEELILDRTKITDAGLEQLEGFTQLRTLSLNRTKVTDAGLKHVEGLSHLEELRLSCTKDHQRRAGVPRRLGSASSPGA
jgi:uncharacterized membrane protein YciS (DUF1049 family)